MREKQLIVMLLQCVMETAIETVQLVGRPSSRRGGRRNEAEHSERKGGRCDELEGVGRANVLREEVVHLDALWIGGQVHLRTLRTRARRNCKVRTLRIYA